MATWLLEGRARILLRPDAVSERLAYAFVANLLVGLGGAVLLIRWARREGADPTYDGFPASRRSWAALALGLALGLGFLIARWQHELEPVILVNGFAQVFVTSAAEVLVCWAAIGSATARAARNLGRFSAVIIACVATSLLFGLYHFAHSPPFNELQHVLFLSVVGLATSSFYFATRDAAGTIVFQTFLGSYGVVEALRDAGRLAPFQEFHAEVLLTGLAASAAVAAAYWVVRRRAD